MSWSVRSRPKLPPWPLSRLERAFDLLAHLAVVFALWAATRLATHWPDEAPVHFDWRGRPNAYGSPFSLVALLLLTLASWGGLWALSRVPHLFNYPRKIDATNAAQHYALGRELIMILRGLLTVLLALLFHGAVRASMDPTARLSPLMVVLAAAIGLLPVLFVVRHHRVGRL